MSTKPSPKWHNPGRPTRDEVMKALRTEGVDSVEGLVERMIGARHSRSRPASGVSGQLLAQQVNTPKADLQGFVHQPPQVPLYVDGVSVDPDDISRFNGQALHSIVKPAGSPGKFELHAFTGDDHIRYLKGQYAESLGAGRTGAGKAGLPDSASPREVAALDAPFNIGQVQMFENINYDGDWWWLPHNTTEHDVRLVERGCFLWWCSDWNDTISSMAATDTKVIYWSDINFQGSTLTVFPYTAVPDLRVYGWNDVISSVWNVGY